MQYNTKMQSSRRLSVGVVLHDLSLGGTQSIALRLANQWAQQGASVTVFCGTRAGLLRELLDPSVPVVEPREPVPRSWGSRARLAKAAARYFHAHPVDVCFIPGNYHWPVAPALAALPASTRPVIVAQVSAALDKPQRGRVRQALFDQRMRRLLRSVDGVVCLSERAREQANRILQRDAAIRIRLPALDEGLASPAPVPAGCNTLLAAGRLVPEKGFHELIQAFAMVDDPSARLVIVGSGPQEQNLRGLVSRLGLSGRVTMPGFVPDIRPWLDKARALVLSSHFEGFPAVLIEALAAGRQVIATRCTHAIEDLSIDGNIGSSVPFSDVQAMAAALRQLLAGKPTDPAVLAAQVAAYRIGPLAEEYLQAFENWGAASARNFRVRRASADLAKTAPELRHAMLDLDPQSM